MEAESFFARWSKRNAEAAGERQQDAAAGGTHAQSPSRAQSLPAEEQGLPKPPPTLEDVAALTADSDFKPFVARGVDENVRRSAMKKLFADPQFNVMDGLDVYIDDYSKFQPMTPQILAALNHAQALLDPLSQIENPLMRLLQQAVEEPAAAPAAEPSDPARPAESIDAAASGTHADAHADASAEVRQHDLNTNSNQASHDHPI
ncbi:DUF3306 domain-containing protein [Noviherbaspirillum aerium]|uniref:DUF3306 domain-containing protein n=1 Tax=Noviherbaspirillum aerium TaxID=2588497 RepID=UPI00124E0C2B|nr:DUF3306 domain-containing protein [Noviherbaspirillum aerium]